MANFNSLNVSNMSFIAGGTIGINRAVKLDSTTGQVVVTAAITDIAIGVATNSASSGEMVSVQLFGKAKAVASDAVSVGAELMPTGSGSGKVVTASGATAVSMGLALTASGADGDTIEILLACPNVRGSANT